MSITLDIVLIALLLLAFFIGYKKGFVKSVWKIAALVLPIVLMLMRKLSVWNSARGNNKHKNFRNGKLAAGRRSQYSAVA